MNDTRTIKLSIESRLEEIALVGLAVRGIVSNTSLGEIERYHVEVSVVEAVTNVIRYAYQGESGHDVEVTVLLSPDRIECSVSDTGLPMEGLNQGGMDFDPADRMNLPEGGMGISIILMAMDEVTYESRGGNNTLRMIKRQR